MAQPRVAGMDAETFDQAVRRAKAYLQDGADCIHPIVLDDLGTLKRLPEAVPAPIICRITLRGTHLRPGPRLQGNGRQRLLRPVHARHDHHRRDPSGRLQGADEMTSGEGSSGPERQPSATARTGASPFAMASQRSPASPDRKTQPSSVPMTTVRPRAARQPVSRLSANHSGSPA